MTAVTDNDGLMHLYKSYLLQVAKGRIRACYAAVFPVRTTRVVQLGQAGEAR